MDCDETGNCYQNSSCIENYRELELYIKGNNETVERLKAAFLFTGKSPSKFVKILYNFKVSNDVNDSEVSSRNCSDGTSKYIWSDSALYLLGPQTLAWFTFFTVKISEITISIDLPCLCYNDYDNLLSRLTYMVRH